MQQKLLAVQCAAQLRIELLALDLLLFHLRQIELVSVAPLVFCEIHRCVGVFQQGIRVFAVAGVEGDADAGGNVGLVAVEIERRRQRLHDLLRDQPGVADVGQVRQHDGEFVPAQPANGVAFAHTLLYAHRDLAQQLVAGSVAVRVVDGLEVVEVHEQYPDRPVVAFRLREHLVQTVGEQKTVRQIGDDVELREKGHLVFGFLALDELPDLAADRLCHLQQRRIRLVVVRPEEFHDADGLVIDQNRECVCALPSQLDQTGLAAERRIVVQMGEPGRRLFDPGAAQEAAGSGPGHLDPHFTVRRVEFRLGCAPVIRTRETTPFFIRRPSGPIGPSHRLAHGLYDSGHGLADRDGFREQARHRMLHGVARRRLLSFGDVTADARSADNFPGGGPQRNFGRGSPARRAMRSVKSFDDHPLLDVQQRDSGRDDIEVLGGHPLGHFPREVIVCCFADDVLFLLAAGRQPCLVGEQERSVPVLDVDVIGQGIDDGAQQCAFPGHYFSGLLALGNVLDDPDVVQRLAGNIARQRHRAVDPEQGAVLADKSPLG